MRTERLLLLVLLAACGGGQTPIPPPPALLGDGGAPAAGNGKTTAPPAGLPPIAAMPPPGVAWSKKAKRKSAPACASSTATDPAERIKKNGESCAAAAKLKPVGAPFRGNQSDKDPHAEHKFKVEANRCYRVYFASSADAKDTVAVVRDSAGDIVAESPGAVVPDDALMCFATADEVTLLIGVGSGKGAYAAQVWSE